MLGFVAAPAPDQLKRLEGGLSQPEAQEDRLLAALRRVGVAPFAREDVEAYKRAKARHETPRNWWLEPIMRHYDGMIATAMHTGSYASTFLASLLAFGWIFTLVMAVGLAYTGQIIAVPLALFAFGHFSLFKLAISQRTFKGRATWRLVDYVGYRGFVPDEVCALARVIARRVPGVNIEVDVLVQGETALDPFLVVSLDGGSKHYVAVWDEDYADVG